MSRSDSEPVDVVVVLAEVGVADAWGHGAEVPAEFDGFES